MTSYWWCFLLIAVIVIITLCKIYCCGNTPLTYTRTTVVNSVPVTTVTVSNSTPNSLPYPIQQNVMPTPPQGGGYNIDVVNCPYPTNPQPAMTNQNLPTYQEATSGAYRQAAYNPHFQQ